MISEASYVSAVDYMIRVRVMTAMRNKKQVAMVLEILVWRFEFIQSKTTPYVCPRIIMEAEAKVCSITRHVLALGYPA